MKLKNFLLRKLRGIKEEIKTIPIILIVFAILALPGVVIGLIMGHTNPDTLFDYGVISIFSILFIMGIILKISEIVKEYKNFDNN